MAEYWKTTAELFESLFEKPKMSEKLLCKPPFRYLFDIISETTNVTGFATGLFSAEELDSGYYSGKDQKLTYLNKIIDLVSLMLKREFAVKASRIVAGHEPENTNIFLQGVYEAAVSGEEYSKYVEKVLKKHGGGAPVQEKPQEKAQEKPQEKPKKEKPQEKPQEQPQEKPKEKERKRKEEPRQEEKQQSREEKRPQKKEPEQQQRQQPQQQEQEQQQQQQQKQTIQRPSSAMKKPPKLKSNVQVEENANKKRDGPTGLIIDGAAQQKEQDEEFILVEKQKANNQYENVQGQNHGKFVRDAMKDDNEQENEQEQQPAKQEETTGKKTIKMGRLGKNKKQEKQKEVETAVKSLAGKDDLETLKNLVQNLCQNTNPLGKSLEFLNDDIESMNKEFDFWRKQFLTSRDKFLQEQRSTDDALQPLQDKILDMEQTVRDQKMKIQNSRAQIIKNQSIIDNLLFSVVSNKQ